MALTIGIGMELTASERSYMNSEDVAVFYPSGYEAARHEPSPIFMNELKSVGDVPAEWNLRPEFSTSDGKSVARIPVGKGVDFYGNGEVSGPLRRNGREVRFWNTDAPKYEADEGRRLYQSHPWVMGIRQDGTAFGVIADNTWKSSVSLDEDIVFESEGPAFRVIVIEKESPAEVLRALADLTGHIEMPPLWALGYQQCRWSYFPDTRVKEIADSLRINRIPSDVIWMDIDYMDNFKIFTFDKEKFPDPIGLNDYLHDRNFKAVYMIDPGIKVEEGYRVDDQGPAADYWVKDASGKPYVGEVWPGPCHFPDFTRPEVREWWGTLYKDYMATGIDGVWNDMNEPAIFNVETSTMPEDNRHLGGDGLAPGPHLRYHNVYGYNMVKASRDGILAANPDKRPFVLTRSNFLGGHRYAATWTGDNASDPALMKMSIPMTINLGLSGQPFNGPDIGGFFDDCTPELLAQWTSMGVYFPFVRNHSAAGTRSQEPWAFGPETLESCRTAINRRYRLLPYIYTLFREAYEDGMPVMRPLFFADVKDPSLRSEQEAFLLGGDLMVVPRWSETTARPSGEWNKIVLEDTPDDGFQANLYQRPGSIIPVAELSQNTTEYNTDRLTLLVNLDPEGKAARRIYEDAGDGFEFRDGEYADYTVTASTEGNEVTVKLSQTEGNLKKGPKSLRVGFVTPTGIKYTPWTKGDTVVFKKM
ncbi:MAG: DUF5110 domain-containing protein [Muribaculaceae bacterium]|nr:DUF5110 domain-containing protein [Muribaculaceae bacterium]